METIADELMEKEKKDMVIKLLEKRIGELTDALETAVCGEKHRL
ncbi:hypothetical protein [Halarsenatibacter silvermanii]|uniref:Uncharacterized protein n=1 Tax=Halarsenatibacter silvermanii TaxID=321763 RepID=A0A1G9TPD0_9FIRM|nr:hypothetical protein [Halarsenatibacter silvermanii]SDM49607.1 hypothetical protein SAMN04488692_1444 [Halarsenatibacter silvermanii]